ncbi:MAG: substrate-binding domain-containing protein, partial [Thermoleophilia bacterium]|nr:substrate-binding domain-containing protein [Thermoleophilia bacterium]
RSEEPDVKGVVGKLTQGAVDAGMVYATDVEAASGRLRAVAIPAELEPDVAYGAGVVTASGRREQAARFVDGLTDGPCADALRARGFGAPP